MKKNTLSLTFTMIIALMMLCVVIPSAAATDPYITVEKSVTPTEIYLKGDGGMPDTANVILSITGAGDPIPGKETYVPADVVFVVDDTGSMGDDISQVKVQINYLTDQLSTSIPDIRFGLVTYKDNSERDLDLTTNVNDFKSKINALSASYGGDAPEAVELGLQTAYASSWRSGEVAKVIVLIGDAPPHNTALAVSEASAAYTNEYGIYTNAIVCSNYVLNAPDTFSQIASAGHGTYATMTDPSGIVPAIIASIKKVVPSISTAGKNIIVKEVVPSYIEATGFDPAPTSSSGNTYEWDFGTLGIGDTKSITFNAQCTEVGDHKLVDAYPDTQLTYSAWDGSDYNTPVTLPFPETYINCLISNKPPVANAGPDQVVEQTNLAGTPVTLDGSGSTDDGRISPLAYTWTWGTDGKATGDKPTITLPLGLTTVTLTVDDGQFKSIDTVDITVKDTTAPTLTAKANPALMWAPDHKTNTVKISDLVTSVTDICDANVGIKDVKITSVSSDEVQNDKAKGSGNTVDDITITGPQSVDLRAERDGTGDGRVYTINYQVTDASGNVATGSSQVWVLHDTTVTTATDSGVKYTVESTY